MIYKIGCKIKGEGDSDILLVISSKSILGDIIHYRLGSVKIDNEDDMTKLCYIVQNGIEEYVNWKKCLK